MEAVPDPRTAFDSRIEAIRNMLRMMRVSPNSRETNLIETLKSLSQDLWLNV